MNTTRCWILLTTDGEPHDDLDGSPHFATREEAVSDSIAVKFPTLTAAQLDHDCHTITCRCGYQMDAEYYIQHHITAEQAEISARDGGWTQNPDGSWSCPSCG